jgi:pimeloyl-ACP methyl ester carboxylesterase
MARFVDFWQGVGAWARLAPEVQAALAASAGKVALDFWATTTETARRDDYRRIDVPTLILRGARSPAVTRRIAGILATTLPHAHVATIDGAGHMLPLSHADAVNAAVAAHIALHARPLAVGESAKNIPTTLVQTSA